MQQLVSVWFAIDGRRRMIVALSALAMFAAVIALSRLATSPNLSLLYAGLEAGTAGEVVQSLEQQGVAFEIRGNAIFVDANRRDQLRLVLASDNLPAANSQGYELLDTLSGFGTTAQMFDAAYWRAKEGELARTIAASPQFRSARIHISNAASRPFKKSADPTASVTVTSAAGIISGANAKALKYLVASAVGGMTPDDVSVIDGRNGVIVQDDSDLAGSTAGGNRSAEMKLNLQRLLEARVGAGNVVVEVFMDIATESETFTERKFDPDSRVAISTEKEERTTNSNNSRGGTVTIASNLPDGDGAATDNSASSQDSVINERTNYEVSETTREVLRSPGSIRRLSIAVLVNGEVTIDPDTNTPSWSPRSDDEMAALELLVASASGLNLERGDTLTLKSLQFQTPEVLGEEVVISTLQKLNLDIMRLIQISVLAVVSLVLGVFVLRPILASPSMPVLPPVRDLRALPNPTPPNAGAIARVAPTGTAAPTTGETASASGAALTGEIDDRPALPPGLSTVQNQWPRPTAELANTELPADPVERLRAMIENRQDETVDILRTWIDGKEERV